MFVHHKWNKAQMPVFDDHIVYTPDYKSVKRGDHILGIFHQEDEPEYALNFLKTGFENNEAILYMTDYLTKDDIRKKMRIEWKVDNLEELESNKSVLLYNTDELIPEGGSSFWKNIAEEAIINGKSGIRIFIDVSSYIKKGFSDHVIEFEGTLEREFDFPCTIICAYTMDDMKNLDVTEKVILMEHHQRLWM